MKKLLVVIFFMTCTSTKTHSEHDITSNVFKKTAPIQEHKACKCHIVDIKHLCERQEEVLYLIQKRYQEAKHVTTQYYFYYLGNAILLSIVLGIFCFIVYKFPSEYNSALWPVTHDGYNQKLTSFLKTIDFFEAFLATTITIDSLWLMCLDLKDASIKANLKKLKDEHNILDNEIEKTVTHKETP